MLLSTTPAAVSDTALVRALNPGAGTDLALPKVLIIDDDATARLALAAMLGDQHRIVFATSAAEVRSRLCDIDPDVIVCDLMMDDMRGDEFFRWLKSDEQWQRMPVIAVTRLDSAIVRADLLDAGADIVLSKTIAPRELRAYVSAALRTRRIHARVA